MSAIVHDGVETEAHRIERLLEEAIRPDEQLMAWAIGLADTEPWRKLGVGVTSARVVWVDAAGATVVSATYDAFERAAFHSFEAPPWPMYFEAEIRPTAGEVVVVRAGEPTRAVEGHVRSSEVHRTLDTVRLGCEDACALELAMRTAQGSPDAP